MPAQQTKYETCLVDGVTGRGGVGDMRRRVAWAVVVLSIVAGTIVVLSPAANSSKKLDAYKSNTKELKSECADGGGDYVGSSKSGRLGTCMWPDGTETTCDNKKKGKNCTTYGRIVTDDGEFLDFVKGALADVSSVTVVTPDDTGASQQAGSPKKLIRRLLAKEDFEMTTQKLGRTCTNVLQADLITRINESPLVCMGDTVAIFCDTEKEGKSCTIEASTKGTAENAAAHTARVGGSVVGDDPCCPGGCRTATEQGEAHDLEHDAVEHDAVEHDAVEHDAVEHDDESTRDDYLEHQHDDDDRSRVLVTRAPRAGSPGPPGAVW